LRLCLSGLQAATSHESKECLVRMGLADPKSFGEWIKAALLRGALAQAPLRQEDLNLTLQPRPMRD
jgi:hypothetical protein